MPEPGLLPSVSMVIRWKPPEDPTVRAVRLFLREGLEDADGFDGGWKELGDFPGDSVILPGFIPNLRYELAVAPVAEDGRIPGPQFWERVKFTPENEPGGPPIPADVTNFGIAQDHAHLHASWDPVDMGYPVEYEVRMTYNTGLTWAVATLVGRTRDTHLRFPWWGSGAQKFYIKARDPLGRYSATAASFTLTVKALEDYETSLETNEHSGGYTGAKTNVEVDTGNLVLSLLGEAFNASMEAFAATWIGARRYDSGTYVTGWFDRTVVQTERIEAQVGCVMTIDGGSALSAYEATEPVGGPALVAGVARNAGFRSMPQRREASENYRDPSDFLVEIDTAQDGVPTPDGWRRFVPGLYTFRQYRFRVTLRGDGTQYARLTSFLIRHRKRNKKAEGSIAVAGSPGPTAVAFPSGLFTVAPIVVASVIDAAGTEFIVQAADITTSGANLRAYDATGAEVFTGTIHYHAMGT